MTTSIPGSTSGIGGAPGTQIQQEAARSAVRHGGPTQERYESALERYVGAVAGDDHEAPARPRQDFPSQSVGDVMTRDVVTVPEDALFKEIAHALEAHRITGVPVVDAARRVLGIVTASDLLTRIAGETAAPRGHRHTRGETRRKTRGLVAGELMTAPAITTTTRTSIGEAARLAARMRVRTLPVVDADGVLVGIVTRGDLVRLFLRDDADIRRAVERDVVQAATLGGRGEVAVTVTEGVVHLTGRVRTALLARRITAETRRVTGVVDVLDDLDYDVADSFLPMPD